jgi:hypothetical protein
LDVPGTGGGHLFPNVSRVKTRTATLLTIAGVLAASSVAAIVNAQVLDTSDDSRTPVPVAATTTVAVADTSGAPNPSVAAGSTAPTITIDASSCLGRTCLKWGVDGELTALDLALVMKRLALVVQDMATLHQDSLDRKPCPSTS